MKKLFALNLILVLSSITFGQQKKDQLEIQPIIRYDTYPEFSYNYLGRARTNYLTLKGISWGVNANYKKGISSRVYLKAGLGYYRYTFNKLTNKHPALPTSNAREIAYPSPNFPLFHTDRYWYNNLSGNIAIERLFKVAKGMELTTAVNWTHYYTFSKQYHVPYGSNGNDVEDNYHVADRSYFGHSATVTIGFNKNFRNVILAPTIIFPVYDQYKKDEKFAENPDENRSKWFGGIGIGFSVIKPLNKKSKLEILPKR